MIFAGDTSNSVTMHGGSWMWYRRSALSSHTMRINENKRQAEVRGMFAFSCRCQGQEICEITVGGPLLLVFNHLIIRTINNYIPICRKKEVGVIVTNHKNVLAYTSIHVYQWFFFWNNFLIIKVIFNYQNNQKYQNH